MAARRETSPGLFEATAQALPETNAESSEDRPGEGRGVTPSLRIWGTSRRLPTRKGRARSVVMDDDRWDALCHYAIETKVEVTRGRAKYIRSMTVSEAVCALVDAHIGKFKVAKAE